MIKVKASDIKTGSVLDEELRWSTGRAGQRMFEKSFMNRDEAMEYCLSMVEEHPDVAFWIYEGDHEPVKVVKGRTISVPLEWTRTVPFEFTGNAGEYFKIWIVNVFLTILTLGIYSAWAKVRKKRYFYGNTLLQGSSFEYLANPIKILKGRLMVMVIFGIYAFATNLPTAQVGATLLFLLILPWLIIQARAFNARNSSYRNIRFGFRATYNEAFPIFFGLTILSTLTGGLAYPYLAYRKNDFLIGHSAFGTTPFVFSGGDKLKVFYAIYLKAALLAIMVGGVFFILYNLAQGNPYLVILLPLLGLLAYLSVLAYFKTVITNLVWSNTVIGNNRFESTLHADQMLKLYSSNALAILMSLGLLIPWASIRMMHYRLNNINLRAASDRDVFTASQQDEIGAAGEEISEFFDIDVGL